MVAKKYKNRGAALVGLQGVEEGGRIKIRAKEAAEFEALTRRYCQVQQDNLRRHARENAKAKLEHDRQLNDLMFEYQTALAVQSRQDADDNKQRHVQERERLQGKRIESQRKRYLRSVKESRQRVQQEEELLLRGAARHQELQAEEDERRRIEKETKAAYFANICKSKRTLELKRKAALEAEQYYASGAGGAMNKFQDLVGSAEEDAATTDSPAKKHGGSSLGSHDDTLGKDLDGMLRDLSQASARSGRREGGEGTSIDILLKKQQILNADKQAKMRRAEAAEREALHLAQLSNFMKYRMYSQATKAADEVDEASRVAEARKQQLIEEEKAAKALLLRRRREESDRRQRNRVAMERSKQLKKELRAAEWDAHAHANSPQKTDTSRSTGRLLLTPIKTSGASQGPVSPSRSLGGVSGASIAQQRRKEEDEQMEKAAAVQLVREKDARSLEAHRQFLREQKEAMLAQQEREFAMAREQRRQRDEEKLRRAAELQEMEQRSRQNADARRKNREETLKAEYAAEKLRVLTEQKAKAEASLAELEEQANKKIRLHHEVVRNAELDREKKQVNTELQERQRTQTMEQVEAENVDKLLEAKATQRERDLFRHEKVLNTLRYQEWVNLERKQAIEASDKLYAQAHAQKAEHTREYDVQRCLKGKIKPIESSVMHPSKFNHREIKTVAKGTTKDGSVVNSAVFYKQVAAEMDDLQKMELALKKSLR